DPLCRGGWTSPNLGADGGCRLRTRPASGAPNLGHIPRGAGRIVSRAFTIRRTMGEPSMPSETPTPLAPPRPAMGSVLMVSTQGGHLTHLVALRSWWEGLDRLWVCPETPDVVDRLAGERLVRSYSPTTRNFGNLVRNSVLAVRLLRKERPALVVSAGAGV